MALIIIWYEKIKIFMSLTPLKWWNGEQVHYDINSTQIIIIKQKFSTNDSSSVMNVTSSWLHTHNYHVFMVYLTMFSVPLQYTVSNGKMISEYTIGKDMKGRDNVLTEKLSCNLSGWTEDNHYNLSGQFIPKLRYKLTPHTYKSEALQLETTCSMHVSY